MQATANAKPYGIFLLLLCSCLWLWQASCRPQLAVVKPVNETDSVSFLVLGDWGVGGTGHQRLVARKMDSISRLFHVQFIITTGDNFYPGGVQSVTDAQWQTSFETIYNGEGHNVPWFPSLGNHDYGTNPQAQVEYSGSSNRWKMPARYYAVEKEINKQHKALFVFTDTSPFLQAYHRRTMSDLRQQDTAAQLQWLTQTLANANQQWKIVIGHHPIFSSGEHGNTPELISRFKPVLLQSGTDFYLCGHDHILEHRLRPREGLHYLISGGGGAGNYSTDQNAFTRFSRSSPGFLRMTLYPSVANLYFYNEKGALLYQQQIVKKSAGF